jgi:hypothetical protein
MEVKEKCMSLDIEITLPRVISTKIFFFFNIKTTYRNDYYKISLLIPFLVNFIRQIHNKFIVHKYLIANFCCLLPNNNLPDKEENTKSLT